MTHLNTWAAAALIALALSASHLLDGPSELEAMQASELATQDAIDSVAINASTASAEGQFTPLFAKATR
jgi:hypothetical protein